MSIYLDSSVIVALLVEEVSTSQLLDWLPQQQTGSLFVSEWTAPEVSSALSLKVRSKQISADRQVAAIAAWGKLRDMSFQTLAVLPEHFETAASFADRYDLGVRAGDALHLAIASAAGFSLMTLDKTMAAAAPLLGVPLEPLD